MNTSKLYDAPIWSTSTILIVRKKGVRPAVNDFVTDWSKTNSYTNNVIVLFHENERWDTFYPPDTELVLLVVR